MNSHIALGTFLFSTGIFLLGLFTKNIGPGLIAPVTIFFFLGASIVFALFHIGNQIKNSQEIKKTEPKTQAHNEGKQSP